LRVSKSYYSVSYDIRPSIKFPSIKLPSIKFPSTFTERVSSCASTDSQSKNLQIVPKNPPAPMRKILSGSLSAEGIIFTFKAIKNSDFTRFFPPHWPLEYKILFIISLTQYQNPVMSVKLKITSASIPKYVKK